MEDFKFEVPISKEFKSQLENYGIMFKYFLIKALQEGRHFFILKEPRFCTLNPFYQDSGERWVEAKIVEKRYKLDNGYKVELEPLDDELYSSESYYIEDFFALMKSGCIYEKTTETMHDELVNYAEKVPNSTAIIRHSCHMLVA